MLWLQGLSQAPYVVRKCHESWLERNPAWEVTLLDEHGVEGYASVDYRIGNLPNLRSQHKADLMRLDLLARYGGVWVDSTCFCVRPLEEWLPPLMRSGFFAFAQPGKDRLISSWLLAAKPENILVTTLFDQLLRYLRDNPISISERQLIRKVLSRLLRVSPVTRSWWFSSPVRRGLRIGPYFAVHYLFEMVVREDAACAAAWGLTPRISANAPHRLYRAGLLNVASETVRDEIDRHECPVYKTSWRVREDEITPETIIGYLFGQLGSA